MESANEAGSNTLSTVCNAQRQKCEQQGGMGDTCIVRAMLEARRTQREKEEKVKQVTQELSNVTKFNEQQAVEVKKLESLLGDARRDNYGKHVRIEALKRSLDEGEREMARLKQDRDAEHIRAEDMATKFHSVTKELHVLKGIKKKDEEKFALTQGNSLRKIERLDSRITVLLEATVKHLDTIKTRDDSIRSLSRERSELRAEIEYLKTMCATNEFLGAREMELRADQALQIEVSQQSGSLSPLSSSSETIREEESSNPLSKAADIKVQLLQIEEEESHLRNRKAQLKSEYTNVLQTELEWVNNGGSSNRSDSSDRGNDSQSDKRQRRE